MHLSEELAESYSLPKNKQKRLLQNSLLATIVILSAAKPLGFGVAEMLCSAAFRLE
jgi:hypothetical protein